MRRVVVAAVLAVTAAVASGCGVAVPVVATLPGVAALALQPHDPEPLQPLVPSAVGGGSVISAETMPNLPISLGNSGVNAARVVYRSVSGAGGSSEVSGSVFTPGGDAPEGGWPVISFGHGTTGILEACAPSLSNSLLGAAPLVLGYTGAGFAVAITDYQGLGHSGVHPYLDNQTAGYNMIDAVRALRNTFPNVSTRWAAFGGSQGGGASWAANELAGSYAPELNLVGSVSLAPGANMVGLVDKSIEGTLTGDQAPLMQWVLESMSRWYGLDLDDYRTGAAAQDWDALTGCTADKASARSDAASRIGPYDFAPRDAEAADELRAVLEQMSVPQQPASAPMFVAYGDADTFIDVAWTDAALEKACAMGDVITIDRQQGRGHGDVNGDAVNGWIGERFAGADAENDC